jgi:hypothetical protein
MQAIEVTGTIDSEGRLSLDQPLQSSYSGGVRVIVLFPDSEQSNQDAKQVDSLAIQDAQTTDSVPIWSRGAAVSVPLSVEEATKLPTELVQNLDYYSYDSLPSDQ